MAKSKSTRQQTGSRPVKAKSKAAQPRLHARAKFIEVHGHKLTVEQKQDYDRELGERRTRQPSETWDKSERFALKNILYRARPSVQAHKALESMALYGRLRDALTTLGSMDQYPLWISDRRVITIGHELIGHVADELGAIERELRSMNAGIAQEVANGYQA